MPVGHPRQELKTGARVDMDGQKLTDFDLQFMAEVISSAPGESGEVPTIPAISYAPNGSQRMRARATAAALRDAVCRPGRRCPCALCPFSVGTYSDPLARSSLCGATHAPT